MRPLGAWLGKEHLLCDNSWSLLSFVNSFKLSLFVIRHEITFSRGKEIYVKAWQKALETKVCVNRDVSSCAPVAIDQSCRAAAEI